MNTKSEYVAYIFILHCLTVALSLEKGAYPKICMLYIVILDLCVWILF